MISLSLLDAAAARWTGTPYSDNGHQAGVAASCHGLVWALYREAGWDHGIPLGDGPARWCGRLDFSPLTQFMAGQTALFGVAPVHAGPEPGDMLGFRVGPAVAHAGLMLSGGRFVHALSHYGVQTQSLHDPTWCRRLAVLWRPLVGCET